MFNEFCLQYKYNSSESKYQWLAKIRLLPSQVKNKSWARNNVIYDHSIYYPYTWANTANQAVRVLYEQLIQKEVLKRLKEETNHEIY